ncbi:MAG: type 4a pilus biogenesis protein PilO [Candidatus Omnitrophica bacterium]|nr:type 4a pilus biogenesis protein PilO [Candidatus Omnitrophota bacterium]
MRKLEITKNQKKILIIVGIVGLAFVIFMIFVYLPLRKQFAGLKDRLHVVEAEINQIKQAGGEGKSLEEAISFLKERYDVMSNKFPEKEEIVLRELPSLAARLGIDVSSVRPQRKRVIQELSGSPTSIKGHYVQEMPISMSLKTYYKTLGEFFRILNEDFPIFVKIDNVSITRADRATGLLSVDLNVDTYLICPEVK